MACTAGRFEGTWTVLVGSREGSTLQVTEVNGRYTVVDKRGTLYSLRLDPVAFTLRGPSSCLSLRHDCDHLFGIEADEGSNDLRVWGAERVTETAMRDVERDPERPTWRLRMPWTVRVTSDPFEVLPIGVDDSLRIEMHADQFQIFDASQPDPFDTLTESDLNRTLDGAERSVALWRNGPRGQSYLFSMVVAPDAVMEEIEQRGVGDDLEAVKSILSARMRGLSSFEIDLLARHIVSSSNSVGVWGADEG